MGIEFLEQFGIDFIQNKIDSIISIITANAGSLNNALSYIISFFNYLYGIIQWVASYLGIYPELVIIISGIIGGGIALFCSTFVIKLIVRWWSVLAP